MSMQSFVRTYPSRTRNVPVYQQYQEIEWQGLLTEIDTSLSPQDVMYYVGQVGVTATSKVVVNGSALGEIQSASLFSRQLGAPVYKIGAGFNVNKDQIANLSALWNSDARELLSLGCKQAISYQEFLNVLCGVQPNLGQGILNAAGINSVVSADTWNDNANKADVYNIIVSAFRGMSNRTYGHVTPATVYMSRRMYSYLSTVWQAVADPTSMTPTIVGGSNITFSQSLGRALSFVNTNKEGGEVSMSAIIKPLTELENYPAVNQDTVLVVAPRLQTSSVTQGKTDTNLLGQYAGAPGTATILSGNAGDQTFENTIMRNSEGDQETFMARRGTPGIVVVPEAVTTVTFAYDPNIIIS